MNLYPALKARMGNWDYYIVKMQMKDIVKEIGFASEIYKKKMLDEAIQRTLDDKRVNKEIVKYLGLREDRFFSSIVVSALGGNPTFSPVEITDDPKFALLKAAHVDEAFGVLTFDGGQRYFALDGQHRVKSIKTLMEQKEKGLPVVPDGFSDEEISVIMLVRKEENEDEFMRGYRRIFSSLNRYAKPTDRDTNIIMDEDDAIAILTRRLLTEHHSGIWETLKTKGKNVRSGEPYFTTLQTLYDMNEILLMTPTRETNKLFTKAYKQVRPSEDELDALFDELVLYWNALLEEVEVLKQDPTKMRRHQAEPEDKELTDNLLFWPIGQELFIKIIRALLNKGLSDPNSPNLSDVRKCVAITTKVNWSLHEPPWAGLLLTYDSFKNSWQMRSEDRKGATDVGEEIVKVQVGISDPTEEYLKDLKGRWGAMLIPRPTQEEVDNAWDKVAKPLG